MRVCVRTQAATETVGSLVFAELEKLSMSRGKVLERDRHPNQLEIVALSGQHITMP
jgi:hypothetical protein